MEGYKKTHTVVGEQMENVEDGCNSSNERPNRKTQTAGSDTHWKIINSCYMIRPSNLIE